MVATASRWHCITPCMHYILHGAVGREDVPQLHGAVLPVLQSCVPCVTRRPSGASSSAGRMVGAGGPVDAPRSLAAASRLGRAAAPSHSTEVRHHLAPLLIVPRLPLLARGLGPAQSGTSRGARGGGVGWGGLDSRS
ncbi:hypothetical protein ABPG75_004969 [Micractinium tetrahymenae]